jgi:hypothetical protein
LVTGCVQEDETVEIKIKQVIPLSPTTTIEITKDLNFDQIDAGKPQDYVTVNSKFRIPIEIENKNNTDYDNVYIKVDQGSDLLNNFLLYSYSGKPLEQIEDNTFKFDNKLLAKQKNELTFVGQVGKLQNNLKEGTIEFTVIIYQGDSLGNKYPINSVKYDLKIYNETPNNP